MKTEKIGRNFLLGFAVIFLSVFIVTPVVSYITIYKVREFAFSTLYKYQVSKAENSSEQFETVFLGDSSLGNALDAELFSKLSGRPVANLALTGSYEYAGSYNLLKLAERHQPLKNVVLVHSITSMRYGVSYDGYIRSFEDPDFTDLKNFSSSERWELFKNAYVLFFNFKSYLDLFRAGTKKFLGTGVKEPLRNDYIIQLTPMQIDLKTVSELDPESLKTDRLVFLKRIVEFCERKKLHLSYLHAPLLEPVLQRSQPYIRRLDKMLRDSGVPLIEHTVPISIDEVGDSAEHVLPEKKQKYTRKIYDLLRSNLL